MDILDIIERVGMLNVKCTMYRYDASGNTKMSDAECLTELMEEIDKLWAEIQENA